MNMITIKAKGKTHYLPEDFFNNDEEKRTVGLVNDWAASVISIATELSSKHGVDTTVRKVIGMRVRLRRTLGEEVIPHETKFKHESELTEDERKERERNKLNAVESRRKKVLNSGYDPLPYKKTVFREAKSPSERRYMFEYQIVRKMYKDYLEKKINFGTYNQARKWFHDKYGE